MRLLGAVALIFLTFLPVRLTAASEAVGLIIDVGGGVRPAVEAFAEVEAGARYELGADGEMAAIHYAGCVEIRVRGGAVSFGELDIAATGAVLSETASGCPSKVSFEQAASAAAVTVLRGDASEAAIAPRPRFAGGGDAEEIVIRRGGAEVRRLPMRDGAATWPRQAPSLRPGPGYEIEVLGPDGPRRAPVTVDADVGLTVLRR